MAIVYLAVNTVNGDEYVGVTVKSLPQRRHEHERGARTKATRMRFHRAINKYGPDSFVWSVLAEYPDHLSALDAEKAEIATRKPTYNTAVGGVGPAVPYRWKEWRDKISKAHKGRKLTPEALLRLRAARKATAYKAWKSVVCLTDGRFFESVKSAAEYYKIPRNGISSAAHSVAASVHGLMFSFSSRVLTPLEREAAIEAVRLRLETADARIRMAIKKPVICTDTGIAYESCDAAARELGFLKSAVNQVCLGRQAHCHGVHFVYADGSGKTKPDLGRRSGDRHHMAKLTDAQVVEVRNLRGLESQYVTAARYGVSQVSISQIQRGTTRAKPR